MTSEQIITILPYEKPFLFVDKIINISKEGVTGQYTFQKEEFYYQGHFKDNPVTPGVILTEVMAQIGVVCLGIYLLGKESVLEEKPAIALTSHAIDFFLPVFPEEKVTIISEKQYFRFHKLKCHVKMLNAKGELVCRGEIAGMLTNKK